MSARIDVSVTRRADPYELDVSVREGGSETNHHVTLSHETHRELAGDDVTPEALVEAAFRFLLDREPKESILLRFDVTVISRYFPEFPDAIGDYL